MEKGSEAGQSAGAGEQSAGQGAAQQGGWVDENGMFAEGFEARLPDGLGEHSFVKKFKSVPEIIKWGVNADKLIGKKAEEFWNSEDPDVAAKRLKAIGVPDDPKGYELAVPQIPDAMDKEGVSARIDAFRSKAKEVGLSPKQAQSLLDWDLNGAIEAVGAQSEAVQNARADAESALRKEWKGDKYEYNVAKVSEVMDYLGLSEFKEDPSIGNNPAVIKAFFEKLVPLVSNDSLVGSRQSETFASASDRLGQLETDMMEYSGHSSDAKYQSMIREREAILEKVAKAP